MAALGVLCFHYLYLAPVKLLIPINPIPIAAYGYLGVDLFFIVSGFVILSSSFAATTASFAVGRALRLYPAFVLCVALTAIFAVFLKGDHISALQFLGNLTIVPGLVGVTPIDGVYWSLALEIQFYLGVIPLTHVRPFRFAT